MQYPEYNVAPPHELMTACETLCWIAYRRPISEEVLFAPLGTNEKCLSTDSKNGLLYESVPPPKPGADPMKNAMEELLGRLRSESIKALLVDELGCRSVVPSSDFETDVLVNVHGRLENNQPHVMQRYGSELPPAGRGTLNFFTNEITKFWPAHSKHQGVYIPKAMITAATAVDRIVTSWNPDHLHRIATQMFEKDWESRTFPVSGPSTEPRFGFDHTAYLFPLGHDGLPWPADIMRRHQRIDHVAAIHWDRRRAALLLQETLAKGELSADLLISDGNIKAISERFWQSNEDLDYLLKESSKNGIVIINESDFARWQGTPLNGIVILDLVPQRTGAPGRPSSMHLIVNELSARISAGNLEDTVTKQADTLSTWLSENHPAAPKPLPKSIKNKIASLFREAKNARI
jgi:hypothetical protein